MCIYEIAFCKWIRSISPPILLWLLAALLIGIAFFHAISHSIMVNENPFDAISNSNGTSIAFWWTRKIINIYESSYDGVLWLNYSKLPEYMTYFAVKLLQSYNIRMKFKKSYWFRVQFYQQTILLTDLGRLRLFCSVYRISRSASDLNATSARVSSSRLSLWHAISLSRPHSIQKEFGYPCHNSGTRN